MAPGTEDDVEHHRGDRGIGEGPGERSRAHRGFDHGMRAPGRVLVRPEVEEDVTGRREGRRFGRGGRPMGIAARRREGVGARDRRVGGDGEARAAEDCLAFGAEGAAGEEPDDPAGTRRRKGRRRKRRRRSRGAGLAVRGRPPSRPPDRPGRRRMARSRARAGPRPATSARGPRSGEAPRRRGRRGTGVTGFGQSARRARSTASVRGPGGLETMTTCRVSGSASRASRAMNVPSPPTSSPRSRPPTPIPWERPPPPRWTSTESSWSPVPEAATTPIAPRRTRLAKASGVPRDDRGPAVGPHQGETPRARLALESDLLLDRYVVAEDEDVEAAASAPPRFAGRERAGDRHDGEIGAGERLAGGPYPGKRAGRPPTSRTLRRTVEPRLRRVEGRGKGLLALRADREKRGRPARPRGPPPSAGPPRRGWRRSTGPRS